MNYVVKTMEYSEKRKGWMNLEDTFTDIMDVLDVVSNEFNAPRTNGYIPRMTVSMDANDNVIVDIRQEMSQHFKKKYGIQ